MSNLVKKETVYEAVTAAILVQMESALKWKMPWTPTIGGGLTNAITKKRYNGWVNSMFLNIARANNNWNSIYWAGYKQWEKADAQIIDDEKATKIFVPRIVTKMEDGIEKKILLGFAEVKVWNSEQVNGWNPPVQETPVNQVDWNIKAEQIASETMANIQHGDDKACYIPLLDVIKMPNKESFIPTEHSDATENYYSTLFHELTHWTGASDRLNRLSLIERGTDKYAFEELIAELGAAFMLADLGISSAPREDHAAYLQNWIKRLKTDNSAIMEAAKLATRAVKYIKREDLSTPKKTKVA